VSYAELTLTFLSRGHEGADNIFSPNPKSQKQKKGEHPKDARLLFIISNEEY